MDGVIFALILAGIFLIISVFLFFGKGSWLIAGYNTASDEEKEKYDKKMLCRAVGVICLVCSVMLCVLAYLGYRVETGLMAERHMLTFAYVFIGVILVTVIFCSVYINKNCRK